MTKRKNDRRYDARIGSWIRMGQPNYPFDSRKVEHAYRNGGFRKPGSTKKVH